MTGLRIGTRRSPLAIAQADEVRALLLGIGVETELVPMTTSGDEGGAAAGLVFSPKRQHHPCGGCVSSSGDYGR